MMNVKKEILELLDGDKIEAISINTNKENIGEGNIDFYSKEKIEEALEILNFEFDDGYKGEDGYSIYVWSKNWIIVKATCISTGCYTKIPRNPNDKILPQQIGYSLSSQGLHKFYI